MFDDFDRLDADMREVCAKCGHYHQHHVDDKYQERSCSCIGCDCKSFVYHSVNGTNSEPSLTVLEKKSALLDGLKKEVELIDRYSGNSSGTWEQVVRVTLNKLHEIENGM